ncbi:MAG: glycoside hydrolase family 31 protein [Lachnospiraceae bacterium]|nr:glycoside hydrolase family 31 protein [Lachnospiraceae bacterium]
MNYFEIQNDSLIFRADGETLMISPWGPDSLRVRARMMDDIGDDSAALLPPPPSVPEIVIHDREASITNGKIRAVIQASQGFVRYGLLSFYNQDGKLLLQERAYPCARQFKAIPGGSYKLKASFAPVPGEKLYGMGQYQQEIMDLKGCSLDLWHHNTQTSVPFYISSAGYGFLWHNPAIGEVHFSSNVTQWVAESTRQLDYWITAGDTPAQIEERYASVTGTAPMMPEYGLGFWQCKLRYYDQEQVLSIAREYKKRNIPIDVIIIDYYHWPRCGDWRFDNEYFPDPAGMVKELKEMGIETMVSVWPQVDWRSENYEEMKQQGLLVKNNLGLNIQMLFHGNNVFTDVTNPRARDYVWDKIKKNYASYGIKAFWLDEAEPEFSVYDFENYSYHAGQALEVSNIYPREFSRMFYEGQMAMGQTDIVNLVRCAWVGSQRYAALTWSGDIMSTYEDFRKQICAGIHMGIAGIPWWNSDIGGFHDGWVEEPDFQELLIRWFQYGTFCPVMRIHGSRQPHDQVINKAGEVREWTGAPNEVWTFGEENSAILVKFIRIREMMRDYTRSLMQETHEKGSPVIRALFYEFPEDKICWDITDAYMYGPDILVAPICHEKAVSRQVYLPAGASWTHAGTGKVYEGGASYEIEAPIDTLPIFLRDGRQDYLIGQI